MENYNISADGETGILLAIILGVIGIIKFGLGNITDFMKNIFSKNTDDAEKFQELLESQTVRFDSLLKEERSRFQVLLSDQSKKLDNMQEDWREQDKEHHEIIIHIRAENAELNRTLGTLEADVKSLNEKLQDSNLSVRTLQNELNKLTNENILLKQQIEDMRKRHEDCMNRLLTKG